MRDKDNEALIHLIGRGNVETVVSHDIIGRLMLMSVRQPGLAEVYGSVLGFEAGPHPRPLFIATRAVLWTEFYHRNPHQPHLTCGFQIEL